MTELTTSLAAAKVIPVMVINQLDGIEDYARALADNGMNVLEITLRTEHALEAVRRIKAATPDLCVGTGTNNSIFDFDRSMDAGADFLVSPGATNEMLTYAAEKQLPLLPGVATASEALQAMAAGFTFMKLFPAEAVGGIKLLKSLAGPLADARFCPTGGINGTNANDYLALKNVVCVGGSWMLDDALIEQKNWSQLGENIRAIYRDLD
ncbi:MAG: bifunctional 4-hydroxy-2-oxoglutarate aldolase/2-dehydro-3-deoxy-phosphogluconate aldolase [Gammaproteobacteria bacterium]